VLAIYATALAIVLASLAIGRAILLLAGWPRHAGLSGALGLAALVVVAPFLLRLPGRATTATILIVLVALAAAVFVLRRERPAGSWWEGAVVVGVALALGSLPFLFNDRVGVLGEGIFTNDQAAQLYWADWLQHGFGPEPSAVRFGYPIGPQSVAVVAAQGTGASLVAAFNGLLLAIPALTALAALGALERLRPVALRIAAASAVALTYLGASFLAQSAFKETAMGLFVLAFALLLEAASPRRATETEQDAGPRPPWVAVIVAGLVLAAASVLTYSIPGLVWPIVALALWLALEELAGTSVIDWRALRDRVLEHRVAVIAGAVLIVAVILVALGPATDFVDKIGDVGESAGRLSSPVFPGEALGIWPAGDYRIVRGEVSGSLPAVALAALAVAIGLWFCFRRRHLALLATLIAGAVIYLGAREFAQIHVQAKALAVIAPLTLLVALLGLLSPPEGEPGTTGGAERRRDGLSIARYALGGLVLVAALASTVIALRAAPVGFDDRASGLEELGEGIDGESVAFLGVDRAAAYRLRGTLVRAPAGYVPPEIKPRPEKAWVQGDAADFDSLAAGQLDKFDYAITTTAAYGSTPPPNFSVVGEAGDYVLWKRSGETPRSRVLEEGGDPGAILNCVGGEGKRLAARGGKATVLDRPVVVDYTDWKQPSSDVDAAGGQERAFEAPGTATATLDLSAGGSYDLSLQYHSQAELELLVDGTPVATLPPSLDGMYISGAGRGAFWPAGSFDADGAGRVEVEVRAAEPNGLQDALGVVRRVWLGHLAATRAADPREESLRAACGSYVDHFTLDRDG
jgi:hypothetical protein